MKPDRKVGRPKVNIGDCSIDGCAREAKVTGLCASHYGKQWRGDDINVPIQHQMTDEVKQQIIADIKAGMTLIEGEQKYGFNRSNLSRTFKKETGWSLREWKRRYAS